jgi:hypothetical protein
MNPGKADIFSLGRIAMLLAIGDPEGSTEDLGDDFDDEFRELVDSCLLEDPQERPTVE